MFSIPKVVILKNFSVSVEFCLFVCFKKNYNCTENSPKPETIEKLAMKEKTSNKKIWAYNISNYSKQG